MGGLPNAAGGQIINWKNNEKTLECRSTVSDPRNCDSGAWEHACMHDIYRWLEYSPIFMYAVCAAFYVLKPRLQASVQQTYKQVELTTLTGYEPFAATITVLIYPSIPTLLSLYCPIHYRQFQLISPHRHSSPPPPIALSLESRLSRALTIANGALQ